MSLLSIFFYKFIVIVTFRRQYVFFVIYSNLMYLLLVIKNVLTGSLKGTIKLIKKNICLNVEKRTSSEFFNNTIYNCNLTSVTDLYAEFEHKYPPFCPFLVLIVKNRFSWLCVFVVICLHKLGLIPIVYTYITV